MTPDPTAALRALLDAKATKDRDGKTPAYQEARDAAWAAARAALDHADRTEELERLADTQASGAPDMDALATRLGVPVYPEEMEGVIAGLLVTRQLTGVRQAILNAQLDGHERAYVLATLLAHVLLNHPDEAVVAGRAATALFAAGGGYLRGLPEAHCRAGVLGAALLTPRHALTEYVARSAVNLNDRTDARIMAARFRVSEAFLGARLGALGLLAPQ